MKSKLITAFMLVHLSFLSYSQEASTFSFAVSSIPDSLKKDANAVYRLDEGVLEVLSPSRYTLKVHQAVTILNSEGADHLRQSIQFDKFNTVEDIEVKIYNSLGIEMQKYRKKDFSVASYYDGMSLATDDKIMRLSPGAVSFPCTVETKYTWAVTGYIDLPNWIMNIASSSVEQFRYIVKTPLNLDIRYRTVNFDLKPSVENSLKEKVYTWETKNAKVQKIEAGGYEAGSYLPAIHVSPTVFEYDGYKGAFTSWSDFGKWCYPFYEESKPFTDQRIAEIKELVRKQPDVDSKIKVLYDYLKNNMRYVSIQFGIGGYKPFAASFVDQKKYGDCKALTNYMRSLLAVAGIKSYPALINAGRAEAPATVGFPENVFNHVILCVPGDKDSTWLECTSTSSDAGFLGNFTENRNALLLTEKGGVMVSTPQSNCNSNLLTTVNDIFLNAEGGAEVNSKLTSGGSFYELLNAVTKYESERQNELFVNYLHYKEPDELHVSDQSSVNDKHELNIRFVYAKLFDFEAGDKIFFPMNVSRLCTEKMALQETRKTEYLFQNPYTKTDTTIFHLPSGFKVGNLPSPKEISNDYAVYKRQSSYDEASNTIAIVSTLLLKKNMLLPGEYKKVSEMFAAIQKCEADKLILKKANG